MKKKILITFFTILGVALFTSSINKQKADIPDIEIYAKRVFEILASSDSIAYDKEIELDEAETDLLINTILKHGRGLMTDKSIPEIKPKFKAEFVKMKKDLFTFSTKLAEKGIFLKDSKYVNCYYKIKTEDELGALPMARFEIDFVHNNTTYSIEFKESILLNNKWKVANISNSLVNVKTGEDLLNNYDYESDTTAANATTEYAVADSAAVVYEEVPSAKKQVVTKKKTTVKKATLVNKKKPTVKK